MIPPDVFDALAAYLRADAGVSALAAARVWPRELPAAEARDMPRAAVVLVPSGGYGGHHTVSLQAPRCDVIAWGATPKSAFGVYLATWAALRALSREVCAQTLLNAAIQGAGPNQSRDPETRWPFCWSSWTVFASTIPVT